MELTNAKRPKLALLEVDGVLKSAGDGGRREDSLTAEEEQEDTQIQSSLPWYLDHIFGDSIGVSQSQRVLSPRPDNSQVVPLLESQSFLVETSAKCQHSIKDFQRSEHHCSNTPSPPVSSSTSAVAGGSQSSVVLFHSPDFSPLDLNVIDRTLHSAKELPSKDTGSSVDVRHTKLNTGTIEQGATNTRKRKRRRTADNDDYHCPPSCTALDQCVAVDRSVDVFVIVVQVNPAMEVACRNGPMAGQTVSMSSLLVSDPTKSYFKLSLWRKAAAWAERIAMGDIVYFKGIRLKTWQREVVGTTVMHSSVLNLHQPGKKLPARVQQLIPAESVADLMKWGKKHYGYLFEPHSIPKSQREVKFLQSHELMGDLLVHFRAKLLCLISSRVALFKDQPGIEVHFHLLGAAACQWHAQLSGGCGEVWELMYVAVACEGTQTQNTVYTLQATSRTHLRMLDPSCEIASEMLQKVGTGGKSLIISDVSIADILCSRRSGVFKVTAKADSMEFVLPGASRLSVKDLITLSPPEMVSTLRRAVYVGCSSCSQPLLQDENGVYCQCMPCIIKSPGGYPSLSYFFRPLFVTLTDSTSTSISLSASHLIVPKILGINGGDVIEASLSNTEEKFQVQRLKRLFDSGDWVIKCLMTKDENSFIEELSFIILDTVFMHIN